MAVKLHRCGHLWTKVDAHPCWRVQKALDDAGVEYEIVKESWPGRKRAHGGDRGHGPERGCPRSSSRTARGTARSRRTWRRRSARASSEASGS